MTKAKAKRITVTVPHSTYVGLRSGARTLGRSLSDHSARLLNDHVTAARALKGAAFGESDESDDSEPTGRTAPAHLAGGDEE